MLCGLQPSTNDFLIDEVVPRTLEAMPVKVCSPGTAATRFSTSLTNARSALCSQRFSLG